jgi:hypothetical protein
MIQRDPPDLLSGFVRLIEPPGGDAELVVGTVRLGRGSNAMTKTNAGK